MKISIITACYNAEEYITDAIDSVVSQKSENDEYIIIDGNSSDGTEKIVQSYGSSIDRFLSEPDEGQYHAIAKGFKISSGEILCWLNADDILMPWTLRVVRAIFEKFPDVDWITGQPSFLDESGVLISTHSKIPAYPKAYIANGWYSHSMGGYLQQESMFWRRSLWDKVGGLDLELKLAADFNLWRRFAVHAQLVPVSIPLAAFRERPGQQRSSAMANIYEAEVAADTAALPRPQLWWRMLAGFGIVGRSLARSLIYAKGDAIVYSRASRTWVRVGGRRSLSRVSLASLIEEFRLRIIQKQSR
ncbi:glycosyltransferase family 2 protein [Microcoleus sp. F10_A2]